ncbi:MAG TPA: transcriptional regulator [Acidimicrobiia bacterium]|nr:transcriptional regulator [Acidimicrobiia bacterium]
MTHPTNGLDDTVHQRARLGILAVLVEVKRADFNHLKEVLELTDGNLSRHLQTLEEARYVVIAKTFEGRRPRTWVSLTSAGGRALRSEVAALRAVIGRVEGAQGVTQG